MSEKYELCPKIIITHTDEVYQPTAGYTARLVLEPNVQFAVFVDFLVCTKPSPLEKVMLRDIRYIINATYAAVKADTAHPKNNPFTSEEKNSSRRYPPLITISKAATGHDAI